MTDRPLSLLELRHELRRSQTDLAQAMGTVQSAVSRIERQADMKVSTLDDYARALGGTLRILIDTPERTYQIAVPTPPTRPPTSRAFRVIWQNLRSRALVQVGRLTVDGDEYTFSYTDAARTDPEFEPFTSFPSLTSEYRSAELFTFFTARLPNVADPGAKTILDALGLTRRHATPTELLARTPASAHDTIQVVPEPLRHPDGSITNLFLASGIRHLPDPGRAARTIAGLKPGTPLRLLPEPDNPHNPRALLLTTRGRTVGWVPDHLLDDVHRLQQHHLQITVERANGEPAPWHLRLLCRLTAHPPLADGLP
jgi:transcriptional regulator with XRE-family HTH domain